MPEQKLNLKNIEAFLVLTQHYNPEKDYDKLLSARHSAWLKQQETDLAAKEKAQAKTEKPGK